MNDQHRSDQDSRHHMNSMLMRESLVDKQVIESTERQTPIVRMLPNVHVVKIGSRSILEAGHQIVQPVVDVLGNLLQNEKLILGVGGGSRSRHVFSIGLDLGLPTGVLAQLSVADALGNAHILGTLLAPHGVVAIPPRNLRTSFTLIYSFRSWCDFQRSTTLFALGTSTRDRKNPKAQNRCRLFYSGRMLWLQISNSCQRCRWTLYKRP